MVIFVKRSVRCRSHGFSWKLRETSGKFRIVSSPDGRGQCASWYQSKSNPDGSVHADPVVLYKTAPAPFEITAVPIARS